MMQKTTREYVIPSATTLEENRVPSKTTKETQNPSVTTIEARALPSKTTTENQDDQKSNGSWIRLSPELSHRFSIDYQLDTRGSEADLLIVTEKQTGEKRAFKLYRKNFQPKPENMRLMSSLDQRYVVRQVEYGISEGLAYEVMELAEGSLADLIQNGQVTSQQLPTLIGQLAEAVSYLHGLVPPLIHRDLKPDNILVRTAEPFQLILADFSFASLLTEGSRALSTKHRTIAYAAPEAAAYDISRGSDWWSIGMIIAEIASGKHPFKGLDERTIENHLYHRKLVPLTAVIDERLRLLCQGLLTHDQKQRWGQKEVERWLSGDTTLEAKGYFETGNAEPTVDRTRAVKPYRLGNRECWTAKDLAAAFCENWDMAERDIARFQMLYEWLRVDLADHNLARTLHDLSDGPLKQMPDTVKVSFILPELDPSLAFMVDGQEFTEDSLINVLRASIQGQPLPAALNPIIIEHLAVKTKSNWLVQYYKKWCEASSKAVVFDEELRKNIPDLPRIPIEMGVDILFFVCDSLAYKHCVEDFRRFFKDPDFIACPGIGSLAEKNLTPAMISILVRRVDEIKNKGRLINIEKKKNRIENIKKYFAIAAIACGVGYISFRALLYLIGFLASLYIINYFFGKIKEKLFFVKDLFEKKRLIKWKNEVLDKTIVATTRSLNDENVAIRLFYGTDGAIKLDLSVRIWITEKNRTMFTLENMERINQMETPIDLCFDNGKKLNIPTRSVCTKNDKIVLSIQVANLNNSIIDAFKMHKQLVIKNGAEEYTFSLEKAKTAINKLKRY